MLCYQGYHLSITIVALVGISFWVVGSTLFFFVQVRSHHKRLHENRFLSPVLFLYTGLESNRWWWEVGVKQCMRFGNYFVVWFKFVIPETQLLGLAGLAGLHYALFLYLSPYDDRRDQVLILTETAALGFNLYGIVFMIIYLSSPNMAIFVFFAFLAFLLGYLLIFQHLVEQYLEDSLLLVAESGRRPSGAAS